MTGLISPASISSLSDFRNSGKIIHSWFLLKKSGYLRHSPRNMKSPPRTGIIPRTAFWVGGGVPVCPGAVAVGPGIYIVRLMEPAMLQEAVTSMVSPGMGSRGYVYVNVSGAG